MSAVVQICESNGAGEVITHNISNSNLGNFDMPNMDAPTHAIVPGQSSVVKFQRVHVVDIATSSRIDDIRFWQTGALAGAASHLTNLKTSGYAAVPYATPTDQPITGVDQAIPTALPSSANLGIGGSLGGALVAPGYSDYFAHQLLTGANDTTGASASINVQYGEVL